MTEQSDTHDWSRRQDYVDTVGNHREFYECTRCHVCRLGQATRSAGAWHGAYAVWDGLTPCSGSADHVTFYGGSPWDSEERRAFLGDTMEAASNLEVSQNALSARLLLELLKVIHDDGGEHTESLGLGQSVYDARDIVRKLRMELDQAKRDLVAFQRKFGWSV